MCATLCSMRFALCKILERRGYAKTGKRTGIGKKEKEEREAEETESQGSSGTTCSGCEGAREEKAEEGCTEGSP